MLSTRSLTFCPVLTLLAAILVVVFSSTTIAQETEQPLNILYIMADDHAAKAVGAYDTMLSPLNPTPTLDRLADEGMLFEHLYATNSLCMPIRATLMSGEHSHRNGIRIISHFDVHTETPLMQDAIRPEKQLMPRTVQAMGYETAVIGKWHLVAEPVGFDYYNVLGGQGRYMNPLLKEKGVEAWRPDRLGGIEREGHVTDIITNEALDWLENRSAGDEKPFFLMLHYKAPHDMYENAPRYDEYLEDVEIPEPKSLWERGNHGPIERPQYSSSIGRRSPRKLGRSLGIDASLSDDEFKHEAYQYYLKRYLRCVKGIDDNLARVFAYLEESGQWDNTVILYTSDQGMLLGEHDYQDKRWIYEESIHMPLIIRCPGVTEPGSRCDALTTNIDWAPTLIDLAGGEIPDLMQGRSMVPLMAGERPDDWPTDMYYRYWMHMAHGHDVPAHFGVRTERYKLAFFYGLPLGLTHAPYDERPTEPHWEFYDLEVDPTEMNNLYESEQHAKIIAELKDRLLELREHYGDTDEEYPEVLEVMREHWED